MDHFGGEGDRGEGCVLCWPGGRVRGCVGTLYFALNFAVNLKLL